MKTFEGRDHPKAMSLRRLLLAHPPLWNLTTTSREYGKADLLVVSIPKSGRTWIRVFLASYRSLANGVPFSLSPPSGPVVYSHDLWDHFTADRILNCLRGRFLIPRKSRQRRRILLLARDPRDVVVSLYFHLTRREHRYSGPISDMIRHELYGIDPIILIMNAWMKEFAGRDNVLLMRYEDCHADQEKCFETILRFASQSVPVDLEAFKRAVEASRFDRMRSAEESVAFAEGILRPGDPSDPESFKVRKGEVGGYRNYLLDPSDLEYAKAAVAMLDPRYGYRSDY